MVRESFGRSGEPQFEEVQRWALALVRAAAVLGAVVAVAGLLLLVLVPLVTGGVWLDAAVIALLLGGGGTLWVYAQALCGRWLLNDGAGSLLGAAQVGLVGALMMAGGALLLEGLSSGVLVLLLALVTAIGESVLLRSARPRSLSEWPPQEVSRPEGTQKDEYELAATMFVHVIALGLAVLGAAVGVAMVWALVPALLAIDEGWNLFTVYGSALGLVCAVVWTLPHIIVLVWLGTWGVQAKATLVVGAVAVCATMAVLRNPPLDLAVAMVLVVAGIVAEVLLVLEISRRRARRTV